jgi:general secretion pathway protein A
MYTHFYGFSEEPFRDTPDPRFLFAVPGHERALNCLRQGIEEKNGWILLSGEPGSGKTILIRHLLSGLHGKPGFKGVYIFQTRISFEDLLKEILSELGLHPEPPEGKSIGEHFSRSVSPILSSAGTLALFLDEAQDLNVEVLERLYRYFSREYPRPDQIRIIFSGQPPLAEKLDSQELRSLRQQIRFQCLLKPLAGAEARRYLDHRLHLAGGKADVFTPEALDLVIRYGEGIPRTLNIIGDNALRIGHQISAPKISAEIVRKALKAMYIPTARKGTAGGRAISNPLFGKTLYSLAAVLALLALVLFAVDNAPKEKGGVSAQAEPAPPKIKKEDLPPSKPEPKPAPEEAEERPSGEKQIASERPEPQVLPAKFSPPAAKAEAKVKKIINVKKGATLNSLCWQHYGYANITLLDHIMALNPELTDPNLILISQKIRLPDIGEEMLVCEKATGKFQIFLGTFSRPDVAGAFSQEPLLKGKELEITARKMATGETWHRLSAGIFSGKEEALKTTRALKEKGVLPSFGGTPAQTGKNA